MWLVNAGALRNVQKVERVIRNGQEMTLLSSELQRGDVLRLQPGDVVPSDVYVASVRLAMCAHTHERSFGRKFLCPGPKHAGSLPCTKPVCTWGLQDFSSELQARSLAILMQEYAVLD